MLTANFIDFDHLILPDSITLVGVGAGLFFSVAAPAIHGADSWLGGLFSALFGAAFGFGLLWSIAAIARIKFGKVHHEFDEPVEFSIYQPGGENAPHFIIHPAGPRPEAQLFIFCEIIIGLTLNS